MNGRDKLWVRTAIFDIACFLEQGIACDHVRIELEQLGWNTSATHVVGFETKRYENTTAPTMVDQPFHHVQPWLSTGCHPAIGGGIELVWIDVDGDMVIMELINHYVDVGNKRICTRGAAEIPQKFS